MMKMVLLKTEFTRTSDTIRTIGFVPETRLDEFLMMSDQLERVAMCDFVVEVNSNDIVKSIIKDRAGTTFYTLLGFKECVVDKYVKENEK